MRTIIFLYFFTILSFISQAQTLKLRSYSTSIALIDSKTKELGEFSEPLPKNILIIMNDSSIVINAKISLHLNILSKGKVESDEINEIASSYDMNCSDQNGTDCFVTMQFSTQGTYHLFVQYANVVLLYHCKEEKIN